MTPILSSMLARIRGATFLVAYRWTRAAWISLLLVSKFAASAMSDGAASWANPVAPFVEGVRSVLYDGAAPAAGVLVYVPVAAAVALVGGWALFRRMQPELAVVL